MRQFRNGTMLGFLLMTMLLLTAAPVCAQSAPTVAAIAPHQPVPVTDSAKAAAANDTTEIDVNKTAVKPPPLPANALVAPSQPAPASFDAAVDRIAASEQQFLENMRGYAPLVETYVQNMKPDPDVGQRPASDAYFIGKLELTPTRASDHSFLPGRGPLKAVLDKLTTMYDMKYLPLGFAQMIMPDNGGFNRQNYDFKFIRREFVGDVRCLVIDVTPKKNSGHGRFLGRVWVEDQDYNIVRFNGTYHRPSFFNTYLHFDSWRLNMKPGVWLPAYIYSEESDVKYRFGLKDLKFKAQTRLWGYDQHISKRQGEFTEMVVDSVNDQSDTAGRDLSPVESQRAWQHQAEDNILERLTRAGLLAQPGEVEKLLQTVINNLEVTNNLDVQPEVRCRILLTAPLESFTVGHTIVLSRGLIDVLPDEATLAAVLAHELAHIALGHRFETKYAFVDRLFFKDEATYSKLNFHQSGAEEAAADQKAIAMLRSSPYADKLASVGLFVKALEARQHDLPNLVRAHLGNSVASDKNLRMSELAATAPQLEVRKLDQIAALPLGGRLRINPYTDRAELVKNKPVALVSASEKMPFEVTPLYPFVTRLNPATEVATTAQTAK
jgi:hypothetical protein